MKRHPQWFWDQRFISRAYLAMGQPDMCPVDCRLGKDLSARRLDRADWQFSGSSDSYSDAHLVQPTTDDAVWAQLMEVWRDMFPDEADRAWPIEFRQAFLAASAAPE